MKSGFRFTAGLALALVLLVGLSADLAAQQFPRKGISVVVFSSAGGGTDVISRQLAARMEKLFKQKMTVSNMPGGLGGTAAEHVWAQRHDGYTVLGVSETSCTFLINQATKHGIKDWNFFIAAGSPGVIAVKADSPLKSFDDLVRAAKANPKGIKVANSGKGKLWNIKVVVLEKSAGVEFLNTPYNGSNPAILSTLSGETDAVSCALGECSEQVRAGAMRVLVVTEDKRSADPLFKDAPAITEKYPEAGKYFPLAQWLGYALPKDVPAAAVNAIGAAFDKVMRDPSMQDFLAKNYLSPIGLWGARGNAYAVEAESMLSWISKELGIAKIDPAAAGIKKPSWAK